MIVDTGLASLEFFLESFKFQHFYGIAGHDRDRNWLI